MRSASSAPGSLSTRLASAPAASAKVPAFSVVSACSGVLETVRRTLEAAAAKHGFDFVAPPLAYCTDNAAMIALAGAERLALGLTSDLDVAARPRWPLDEARAMADPVHQKTGRKGAKA